jgi:putative zinc finger protein
VSCQPTRELLSAWVDGAATPAERAAVESHLATCADCRHELDHLRETLTLLREAEPARAPAGFVDRVLARVRPAPRRRLLARVFLPLGAKLPVEAAAIVMVAVLVAYVARETPELGPALPRAALPSAAPERAEQAEPTQPAPRPAAPRSTGGAGVGPETARPLEAAQAGRLAARPQPEQSPAPAAPRRLDVTAKTASSAVGEPRPGNAAPAGGLLAGTLAVADRADASRELAELLRRLGGSEVSERAAGETVVVEATLPEGAYAEVVRELGRIGAWTPTQTPVGAPVRLRVTLKPAG